MEKELKDWVVQELFRLNSAFPGRLEYAVLDTASDDIQIGISLKAEFDNKELRDSARKALVNALQTVDLEKTPIKFE